MWQAITQQLSDALMFQFDIREKNKVHGGDINECYMISDGEQRYFVKLNERDFIHHFEVEGDSLHLLHNTATIPVPELILSGTTKTHAFMILNYIPMKPLDDEAHSFDFGVRLAHLHQWGEQKEYGLDNDNYVGATIQPNPWDKKWGRFFAEQRIGWQLQLLKEKGIIITDIDECVATVQSLLANHNPRPSLLHGDLWHGNVANSPFGPICYDPASYWGDRECDIAMTELFGGFLNEFYHGYNSVWPLDTGYQERREVYNLYHVLNHCNLFGGHYLDQAQEILRNIMR